MVKRLIALVAICVLAGIGAYGYKLDQLRLAHDTAVSLEKRPDISITIIEGKRREEIAAQLQAAGITSAADFLAASVNDEGTLFPDTYRFFPNTPASEVVAKMEADYTTRVAGLNPTKDQLILASIVEREASNDAERPIIAGVYTERLSIGMKLQSDPTVQYAKDSLAYAVNQSLSFKFWQPITAADYTATNSPYNTYLIPALPPGPICNPGLASIKAAMNPTPTDDLYFIEENGQLLLAKTLAQHTAQAEE